jgi:hypothetical protein
VIANRLAARRVVILGALLLLVGLKRIGAQGTTGAFHGCPPDGKGGDPALSELKNRDIAPGAYEDMTLIGMIKKKPSKAIAMGKRHRDKWTPEAIASVEEFESKGVRAEGRLIAIRTQGPESCNCGSDTDVDTHMWIATVASASAKPTRSMVVEISPRELDGHPGWDHDTLVSLAKKGTRVRISGWVTWDHEHGSEVGKSRGTLWEIHPIHRIDVFRDGAWRDLDEE